MRRRQREQTVPVAQLPHPGAVIAPWTRCARRLAFPHREADSLQPDPVEIGEQLLDPVRVALRPRPDAVALELGEHRGEERTRGHDVG